MLTIFRHWLIGLLGGQAIAPIPPASNVVQAVTDAVEQPPHQSHAVPYDEQLLEKSRTQWQHGDWDSLSQLDRESLQHHPDRAKLALLAAAGRLQTGRAEEGRQYIRLAQDWGASKHLVARVLVAGVHNSLGRASAVVGDNTRALQHFQQGVAAGTPGSDARLLTHKLVQQQYQQLQQLGFSPRKPA